MRQPVSSGPKSPGQPSGRRDKRYRVRMPVTLSLGDATLELQTGDVSLRGLFLLTDRPLRPRQFIRLDLTLPFDGKKLSLFASVAYSRPPPGESGLPPGSGIELYGNGSQERGAWGAFIGELERRLPEALVREVVLGYTETPPEPTRRRYPRFEAVLQVRGYFGELDDLVLMYTRDISKGGMFLQTEALLGAGAEVDLRLVHPTSGKEFALRCVVRRTVHDRAERGMGVEFLDMDEHRRHLLWDFITSGAANIPKQDAFLDAGTRRTSLSSSPPPLPARRKLGKAAI